HEQRRRWERLRCAAEQWRDSGEDRKLLWSGSALAKAWRYPNLGGLPRRFLEASQREEDWQALLKRLWFWGASAALVGAAILATAVPLYVWKERERAKADEAGRGNVRLGLQMSLMHVDAGTHQADRGDVAGAVTWHGSALELLDANERLDPKKE